MSEVKGRRTTTLQRVHTREFKQKIQATSSRGNGCLWKLGGRRIHSAVRSRMRSQSTLIRRTHGMYGRARESLVVNGLFTTSANTESTASISMLTGLVGPVRISPNAPYFPASWSIPRNAVRACRRLISNALEPLGVVDKPT